ncbi:MAG: DUF11 domain-containing protein [Candidatus Wallbacteria bacterium]|nr:DUF11 domain-containing protein [Candidatus Wallbacteria bacterium]
MSREAHGRISLFWRNLNWLARLGLLAWMATGGAWAVTFPSDSSFVALKQAGSAAVDKPDGTTGGAATGDGDAQGAKNLLGTSLTPVYFYNDGTNLFFRFRVDDDPDGVTFGYGIEFDTDGNNTTYEAFLELDQGDGKINIFKNTSTGTIDDPSDEPDSPAVATYTVSSSNVRFVPITDTQIGNKADWFVDFTVPLADFKTHTGLNDVDPMRMYCGTSPSGGILQSAGGDLMGGLPFKLSTGFSDPVNLSGKSASTGVIKFVAALDGTGDVTQFDPGDTVFVRVDDSDQNSSSSSVQTVSISITSSHGDTIQKNLTETGNDTGIFTASLATSLAAANTGDSTLQVPASGTVTATYLDEADANFTLNQPRNDTAAVGGGTDGTIEIDPSVVPGASANITVTDADLNTNTGVAESVDITVTNSATNEFEIVTLTETGANTGIFVAALPTAQGTTAGTNDDGSINAKKGDTLVASYLDQLRADGGSSTLTDDASVVAPVVEITKTVTPSTAKPGETVVYKITFSNTGNATAHDVAISD